MLSFKWILGVPIFFVLVVTSSIGMIVCGMNYGTRHVEGNCVTNEGGTCIISSKCEKCIGPLSIKNATDSDELDCFPFNGTACLDPLIPVTICPKCTCWDGHKYKCVKRVFDDYKDKKLNLVILIICILVFVISIIGLRHSVRTFTDDMTRLKVRNPNARTIVY